MLYIITFTNMFSNRFVIIVFNKKMTDYITNKTLKYFEANKFRVL